MQQVKTDVWSPSWEPALLEGLWLLWYGKERARFGLGASSSLEDSWACGTSSMSQKRAVQDAQAPGPEAWRISECWRAESESLMLSASCPQLCWRKRLSYSSLWVETWVLVEHTLCAVKLVLGNIWVSRVLGSKSFYQLESLPRVVELEEEKDKGGGEGGGTTYNARRFFYLDSTLTHANLKIEFIACCFIREDFNVLCIYHGYYSLNSLASKQKYFTPEYKMPHVLMIWQHATLP